MSDIPNVELARPGTWHLSSGRRTFDTADLKDAADFWTASGSQKIPLGFGHSDSRFDGDPAFGWVSNIRFTEDAEGPVLLGDLVDMDSWVAAAAPKRWPNRSIEGFANLLFKGRTYRLALTRLALLGATPPGMPGLKTLAEIKAAVTGPAMPITAASRAHLTRGVGTFIAASMEEADVAEVPEEIADAVRTGRLAPHEVDLAMRLHAAEVDQEGEDEAGWVVAQVADLPADRVAASGVPPLDEEVYQQHVAQLWGPNASRREPVAAKGHHVEDAELVAQWPAWQRPSLMATADPAPSRVEAAQGGTIAGWLSPLDRLRAESPGVYMSAIRRNGSPPGPFAGSNDPGEFLRSGLPSSALDGLPLLGQIAGWYAGTPQAVHAIRADLGDENGELYAQMTPQYSDHEGVRDWNMRINEWASRGPQPEQALDSDYGQLFPPGNGPMDSRY